MPIFEQLQLEEALLRTDKRNWCIVNHGSPSAIVMGISGKPEQLINYEKFHENPVPVIKRYSGGGTVFIDPNTYFVTWICNRDFIPLGNPREILKWSEKIYAPLFGKLPFRVLENDYVIGERKFGGNAQYLRKDRWMLHTSFLWDFDKANMDYLLMPQKIPDYRKKRNHDEFLCKLKDHFPDKEHFVSSVEKYFQTTFPVKEAVDFSEAMECLSRTKIQTTKLIDITSIG